MSNYPPPPGGLGYPQHDRNGYPQQGPGFPPAGMPPKTTSNGALVAIITLGVVGVLIAIVGIFAVLAIYGTRKYIANAKTAEARNSLAQIARDAATTYEHPNAVMIRGTNPLTPPREGLCPSSRSVPRSEQSISAKKYQSASSEWTVDPGWSCLGFEMTTPQYYQYNYTSIPVSFTATARGDLNGDGRYSTFQLEGQVEDGRIRVAPMIKETNPEE